MQKNKDKMQKQERREKEAHEDSGTTQGNQQGPRD